MPKHIRDEALELHARNKGKLEIRSKLPLKTRRDLSIAYTPHVAEVSKEIAKNKLLAYKYTIKSNSVAIVTDGSAVLGLGNVGAYASIPVMEGKAILFKEFAGIDAFPIILKDFHDDFIDDVRNIEPIFGGIILEDIAAPKCFEVEEKLQDVGVPVMHDDQWGTAVVLLAGLINAARVVRKDFSSLKVVINGAGAAGIAIARVLTCYKMRSRLCRKVKDVVMCDSKGIIYPGRDHLNRYKEELLSVSNRRRIKGSLKEAMAGADVFIGVSVGGCVTMDMVRSMSKDPIIFAMANPTPEIMPDKARKAGAAVIGTGRSDFANQINNVLAFPGIFRGALDTRASVISDEMKFAAAYALADYVKEPTQKHIIPDPLDKKVVEAVAAAVAKAAIKSGCARII